MYHGAVDVVLNALFSQRCIISMFDFFSINLELYFSIESLKIVFQDFPVFQNSKNLDSSFRCVIVQFDMTSGRTH